MSFAGNWNITMKTPMGDRAANLTLVQDGDALSGSMESDGNSTDITNGRVEDGNAKWDVDVTTPMPLTLSFDVGVDGDDMTGNVKLGMFGNSAVSGSRA